MDLYEFDATFGTNIAGMDEVGRGPGAGPVVAVCLVLNSKILGVNDSKQLSDKRRRLLYTEIRKHCQFGIGAVGPRAIDTMNILEATKLAMHRAFTHLAITPEHTLIDHLVIDLPCQVSGVTHGDAKSAVIAAASIVAKVRRDNYMIAMNHKYPGYGFDKNAGYLTREHISAISKLGLTPIHRRSFIKEAWLP